jgi:S-layer family protein
MTVRVALLAVLAVSVPALAQTSSTLPLDVQPDPETIAAAAGGGIETQYLVIPASDFLADEHDIQDFYRGPDGYRGVAVVPSNPRGFHGPLTLPNGAIVESICFALYDDDDNTDIELSLVRTEVALTAAQLLTLASKTPPFAAGYFLSCLDFDPLRFRSFTPSGFGGWWLFWEMKVRLNAAALQAFRGAVVGFRLGISGGPNEPTFADVFPGTFPYPYVEALAAAGITQGCTADRFCPNQPVTRAQLAIMLARALGLHWSY